MDKKKHLLYHISITFLMFRMQSKKYLKIILFIITAIIFAAAAYGVFFLYEMNIFVNKSGDQGSEKMTFVDTIRSFKSDSGKKLAGEDSGRINILLLGIAGEGKPGQNLTDTILVMSIDTDKNRVALLSIPRDLFTAIPEKKTSMKINSVYQYALNSNNNNPSQAAYFLSDIASNVTGQKIHYWAILNFDGFEKIVDSIGGVNIINENDIYDSRYPGKNYSYETFELKKGFHALDGKTALKYVRERHADPDGDFGRARRQQQVLQSLRNKVFSAKTYLNVFAVNNLFSSLGDNIKTNVAPEEFQSFLNIAKKIDSINISQAVLTAWDEESLLRVSHSYGSTGRAFVLIPRVGNFSEIHDLASNIFNLEAISRRKKEIASENCKIGLINKSGSVITAERVKKMIELDLKMNNILIIRPQKKLIEETTEIYDFSGGKKPFTTDELLKKIPATLSRKPEYYLEEKIQDQSFDLIIVLGQDTISKYNMEEVSYEEYRQAQKESVFEEYMEFNQ